MVPEGKFVVRALDRKRWRKRPSKTPFQVRAVSEESRHDAHDIIRGARSAGDCNENLLMEILESNLILEIKSKYGWQVKKLSTGVGGTVHSTCTLLESNLETMVLSFAYREPSQGIQVRIN